jgi:hypothetical protein
VDPLRFRPARQVELVTAESCQRNEGMVLALEMNDIGGANGNGIRRKLGNTFLNQNEAVGRTIGQRAQNDRVDHAENGGGRADAEGEREDADGAETGIFVQLSDPAAEIEESRMEPVAHAPVANLFLHLFNTAEFHSRHALRFVRRHARTNVFVDQH